MTSNTDATSGGCCWICLDDGDDEHGRPLTRNCGCRGELGWVHISCLSAFAKTKTGDMSTEEYIDVIENCKGTPWSVCHTCKQEFHVSLKVTLAQEWVDAIDEMCDSDIQHIAAKLNLADSLMHKQGYDEAIQICEDLRGVLKSNMLTIDPVFWAIVENHCLASLAVLSKQTGNVEKERQYAEEYKSWNEKIGSEFPSDGLDDVINMMGAGEGVVDDRIKIMTDMYNQVVEQKGYDSPHAIKLARNVGDAYAEAYNMEESHSWHKEAHDRAKRVFGKEHPDYLEIKKKYLLMSTGCGTRYGKLVVKDSNLNGKEVPILKTANNGTKYIVDIGTSEAPQKVKVTPSQLVFSPDTPITIVKDGYTAYIDSFNKRRNTYKLFIFSGVGEDNAHVYYDIPRNGVVVKFPSGLELSMLAMTGL